MRCVILPIFEHVATVSKWRKDVVLENILDSGVSLYSWRLFVALVPRWSLEATF